MEGNHLLHFLVYVDDILIAANRVHLGKCQIKIHSTFSITDNEPLTFWLNMHFIRNRATRTIAIHQEPKSLNCSVMLVTLEDRIAKTIQIPHHQINADKAMCPTEESESKRMQQYPYKKHFRTITLYRHNG
jgi:hypothetical protein